MNSPLSSFTREELEKKLIHMTAFIAYQLATEWIELTEPTAKVIRTPEAEKENTDRVLQHIVCVWPAWDVLEKTHESYHIMKEWVECCHKQALVKPCICDGCKIEETETNNGSAN